jgi:uncharacterized RDD family membrane protein YckC
VERGTPPTEPPDREPRDDRGQPQRPDPDSQRPAPGMPDVPPPGMPSVPPPAPQGPAPEAPGGARPQPPGGMPPPPDQTHHYGGPVPPGGWQTPAAPLAVPPGRLASWGSRLGAALVDGLVLAVPAVTFFVLIVASAVGISGGGDDDVAVGAAVGAILLWLLLVGAVSLLYAPLLMMRSGEHNGQTWGKQALGIRVVRDNREPFTFGSAALREVVVKQLAVGIASAVIPLIPWFLNYFWPLWDDENRALHDMAVSTHVVRT